MRLRLSLIAAALLISTPAWAEKTNPDLPKPDPKGYWRVLTQDDDTTTSKCIGNLSTPLCTLETYLASLVRYRDDFYSMSVTAPPSDTGIKLDGSISQKYARQHQEMEKYHIQSAKVLTKADIPPPFLQCHIPTYDECRELVSEWKPGDVRILVTSRRCGGGKCETEEGPFRGLVLRHVGEEWKVVVGRRGINRLDPVIPGLDTRR
ncbi:MAG TPA: hypothetical protein VM661_14365 [Candidatus Sulfotelmatobacter sp.]|nr:hypothetical protein [Candidatus Sulfotelmatobacter sp.]